MCESTIVVLNFDDSRNSGIPCRIKICVVGCDGSYSHFRDIADGLETESGGMRARPRPRASREGHVTLMQRLRGIVACLLRGVPELYFVFHGRGSRFQHWYPDHGWR